jgi:hypothetical protein
MFECVEPSLIILFLGSISSLFFVI